MDLPYGTGNLLLAISNFCFLFPLRVWNCEVQLYNGSHTLFFHFANSWPLSTLCLRNSEKQCTILWLEQNMIFKLFLYFEGYTRVNANSELRWRHFWKFLKLNFLITFGHMCRFGVKVKKKLNERLAHGQFKMIMHITHKVWCFFWDSECW